MSGVGLRPSLLNFIIIQFYLLKCISDGLLSHAQKNQRSYLVEGGIYLVSSFSRQAVVAMIQIIAKEKVSVCATG